MPRTANDARRRYRAARVSQLTEPGGRSVLSNELVHDERGKRHHVVLSMKQTAWHDDNNKLCSVLLLKRLEAAHTQDIYTGASG